MGPAFRMCLFLFLSRYIFATKNSLLLEQTKKERPHTIEAAYEEPIYMELIDMQLDEMQLQ